MRRNSRGSKIEYLSRISQTLTNNRWPIRAMLFLVATYLVLNPSRYVGLSIAFFLALFVVSLTLLLFRQQDLLAQVLSIGCFYLFGIAIAAFWLYSIANDPIRQMAVLHRECWITGTVAKVSETPFGSAVETRARLLKGIQSGPIRVSSRVQINSNLKLPKTIEGRGVKVFCKPTVPEDQFDHFLLSKGILAQCRTNIIERESEFDDTFLIYLTSMKRNVRRMLMMGLPHNPGALHQGIVLGEREELDSTTEEDFRKTSTSHILAVSGENLALLLIFCLLALSLFSVPLRAAYLVCIPISIFYSALTGFEPSVLRALCTGSLGLFALYLGRLRKPIDLLAISCIALLTQNPYLMYHVGFQLSFAAAASLIFITPKMMKFLSRIPKSFAVIVSSTAAAQIGVAPIIAYHFNQVSLIGLVANLFVLPVVGWILSVGIISMAIGWLSPLLSRSLNICNLPLLEYLLLNARVLASVPGSSLPVVRPSTLFLFTYYVVLLIIFQSPLKITISPFALFCVVLTVINVLVIPKLLPENIPKDLQLEFFYVGEGDSALITTAQGKRILIDGGPDRDLVLSKLQERRVRAIDLMVLTHPHADHLNGLLTVAKKFKIGSFLWAGCGSGRRYESLINELNKDGVKMIRPKKGDTFRLGNDLSIKVLLLSNDSDDLNERSLVLKFRYGGVSLLFTGDAEKGLSSLDERELRCDVLKVPHHGSFDENQATVFKKMKPSIAVISSGRNNLFGHPAAATVRNLYRIASKVLRTDRSGDIVLNKMRDRFVANPIGF